MDFSFKILSRKMISRMKRMMELAPATLKTLTTSSSSKNKNEMLLKETLLTMNRSIKVKSNCFRIVKIMFPPTKIQMSDIYNI